MNILHVGQGCPETLLECLEAATMRFSDVFEQTRALSYLPECQVTVANIKACGQLAVVKTYVKSKLNGTALLQARTEAAIHSGVQHPHVVRLYAALEDAKHIYLVLEYMEGGDLSGHLGGCGERRAREFIARPLLQALAMLHEEGIVHRDLKPDNVLVRGEHVLLADFGLAMYASAAAPFHQEASEQVEACAQLAEAAGGTPLYTAPEVLLAMFKGQPMQSVVLPKNDIWALGIMLLEALTGDHPFSPENCASYNGNVMYAIAHHKAVCLPAGLSPDLHNFLTLALQRDPELRASAQELLQHPWLTSSSASSHDSTPCRHRALSDELDASSSEVFDSGTCTPESWTPAAGGLSPFDLRVSSTPTKCRTASIKRLPLVTALDGYMCRANTAIDTIDTIDCWEN